MHIHQLSVDQTQATQFRLPVKTFGKQEMNEGQEDHGIAGYFKMQFHVSEE